jgi:hypothetical protein
MRYVPDQASPSPHPVPRRIVPPRAEKRPTRIETFSLVSDFFPVRRLSRLDAIAPLSERRYRFARLAVIVARIPD